MKTKAFYAGVLALVLSATVAKAQIGSHIGFVVGPSLSTMYGSDGTDNLDPKLGYSAGLLYQYAFSTRYALQTGVVYENKGAMFNTTIPFFNTDIRARADYHYIGIPVLFRVHLMPDAKIRPFINAGGYVNFLVNQTTYTRTTVGSSESTDHSSNTGDYRKVDAGIAGGVGLDWLITSRMHLDFEVRDNLGLVNVDDSGNDDNMAKHNNAYFLVSMLFSIP